jgi:hypothetical protein
MAAKNSNRLSLTEFFNRYLFTPKVVVEMTRCGDKPGPALCDQGCTTEVLGRCPHGCPSVLLILVQYDCEWEETVKSSLDP